MNIIHPSAIIETGATIGENVQIGPFCIIGKNVTIGDNTVIKNNVTIIGNTTIGKNNEIFSYATLGSIPQDLKYDGEEVFLKIGDSNKIREYTLLNPGTKGGGYVTTIGSNNLLMGYVHVGHDATIEDNVIIANATQIAGHVHIERNAVIGGLTGVVQFCKIGRFAMIGASSLIDQDIPPYTLAQGNRAVLRGLNLTGLRRNFKNRNTIDELEKAYKALFNSGKPIQEVASSLLTHEVSEVAYLADFITKTKKGIPFTRKTNG